VNRRRRCHKHGIAYQSAIKLPIISRPPVPNKGKKLEIDELEKWSLFRLGSGNWQGNQTAVRVMIHGHMGQLGKELNWWGS